MTSLTTSEIAEISATHLITTPVEPADLLFVFGSREGVSQRVDAIVRLWSQGFFRAAIVTGGKTHGLERTECAIIKEQAVARGVPGHVILEEHHAMNTGENVTRSLPILDAAIGLANIRSLIALGKICTSRRYLMTLQRHWPQVEKMLVVVNYFRTPRERWFEDPEFRTRVLSEWSKIKPYLAKGYIAEWP